MRERTRVWSVKRGQGFPILDAVGSRYIQQAHHRTQSSPSAKIVVLSKNHISEGAKSATQQLWEIGMITKFETILQTSRSEKKRGEEVLEVLEQSFPCSSCRRIHWSRFSPCNLWGGSCWSRYPPCNPLRTSCCRRWKCPQGRCSPRRTPVITGFWQGSCSWREQLMHGFLAGPVTPERTHTAGIYSKRTVTHCKNPCWCSSWRTAACVNDASAKDFLLWEEPHSGAGESMKRKE